MLVKSTTGPKKNEDPQFFKTIGLTGSLKFLTYFDPWSTYVGYNIIDLQSA